MNLFADIKPTNIPKNKRIANIILKKTFFLLKNILYKNVKDGFYKKLQKMILKRNFFMKEK